MKILNKALSVILVILISGIFSAGAAANNNIETDLKSYEYELNLIKSLGIMDENAAVGRKVQRRDFAKILYEILTYKIEKSVIKVITEEETGLKEVYIDTSDFTDEFFFRDEIIEDIDFSVDETQTEGDPESEERPVMPLFSDVSEDDEAFEAIMLVYNSGLMKGTGEGKFEPSRNLTVQEISKILVTILGYRLEAAYGGGYPEGYYNTAYALKLFENVLLPMNAEITADQVAKMIYNAFPVRLLKENNFVKNSDGSYDIDYQYGKEQTFLNHTLGLKVIKGQIVANEISTLSRKSGLSKGEVMLGNVRYKVSDRIEKPQDYLAKYVEAYVTGFETGTEEIRYMECDDEITLIEAEDVGEFSNNVLTYFVNGRERTIEIENGVPIIYNGLAVKTPTVDMYDIDAGSIELIKRDRVLAAVKIWKFKSFYVYGVDEKKEEFFNKTRTHVVNTSFEDDNLAYLYNENGNAVDLSYVKAGQIVSYAQNDFVVTAYITKKFFSDEIDKVYTSDGKTVVSIRENTYEVADEYKENADAVKFEVGKLQKFYLDYFGRIAWVEGETDESVYSGILLGVAAEKFEQGHIKLVGLDDSKPNEKIYDLADSVLIEDGDGDKKKYNNGDEIVAKLANVKYVRYMVDDNEKVNRIILPLKEKGENGKLFTLVENKTYKWSYLTFFGGKIPVGQNTKIVVEPRDAKNGNDYLFWRDIVYDIPAATFNIWAWQVAGEEAPECIFIGNNYSASAENIWYMDKFGANEILTSYDVETGEIYKEVEVIEPSGTKTLRADFEYTDEAGNPCTALDIATGFAGDEVYSLEKGDIFGCTFYDAEKTLIKQVILFYRPTMKSPSGGNGYVTAGDRSMTDMFFVKNSFVDEGDIDIFADTYSEGTYLGGGNPIVMEFDGSTLVHGFLYHANQEEYEYDDIMQRYRQILYFTTQDLSVADKYLETGIPDERVYDSTGEYTGIYINKVFNGFGSTRKWFEYTGNSENFTVASVNESALKPYTRYGKNCTRIILTPQGSPIFINENRAE